MLPLAWPQGWYFQCSFPRKMYKGNKLVENWRKSNMCQWCYNTTFPHSHGKDSVFLPLLFCVCLPGSALERWRLTRWPAQVQAPAVQRTLGRRKQQNKVKTHISRSCAWAVRPSWARARKLDQSVPQQDLFCRSFCVHLYLFPTSSCANYWPLPLLLPYFLSMFLPADFKVSKHFIFVYLTQTSFKHWKNVVSIFVGAGKSTDNRHYT